jgi:hypothetical protein
MKNIKHVFLTLLVVITTLISCQKQPNASFKTDKTNYVAGETIILTNTTIEGHSYKWTMPDGQVLTSKNVYYILNGTEPDGMLTFKLEVFSKNGKKKDITQQSVYVKAATGTVTFWNFYATNYPIGVAINGEMKIINKDYSYTPSCNATGCANFNLKGGTYNYSAFDNLGSQWAGTITIQNNGCLTIELID